MGSIWSCCKLWRELEPFVFMVQGMYDIFTRFIVPSLPGIEFLSPLYIGIDQLSDEMVVVDIES